MSIIITQIRAMDDRIDGWREYAVQINDQPAICTFLHKRGDGLGTCLQNAAKAVERAKWLAFRSEFGQQADEGGKDGDK